LAGTTPPPTFVEELDEARLEEAGEHRGEQLLLDDGAPARADEASAEVQRGAAGLELERG